MKSRKDNMAKQPWDASGIRNDKSLVAGDEEASGPGLFEALRILEDAIATNRDMVFNAESLLTTGSSTAVKDQQGTQAAIATLSPTEKVMRMISQSCDTRDALHRLTMELTRQ